MKLDDGETVDMALSMTKISFPARVWDPAQRSLEKARAHKK